MSQIAFQKVLHLFESNGWKLKKIESNYRIFVDPTGKELPWTIPVEDRHVDVEYYERLQRFFEHVPRDS